jgi:hypothetical protein
VVKSLIVTEVIEIASHIFWRARAFGISVDDSFRVWLREDPPEWLVALVAAEVAS